MSEPLRELYQEAILDHNRSPRNFGKLASGNRSIEGFNPLCGDHLHVHLDLQGERIANFAFEGSGCAISKASTSLMGTLVKGKTKEEALQLFKKFHEMVTSPMDRKLDLEGLGKLAVFSGVREFPMRVKCAILAWYALEAALKNEAQEAVSTE